MEPFEPTKKSLDLMPYAKDASVRLIVGQEGGRVAERVARRLLQMAGYEAIRTGSLIAELQ